MGMFDNIRCEVPLPDGWQPGELQTKDFDCEMTTHVIRADGRLILDRGYHEPVPDAERTYPNAKPGTWESICGIIRWVSRPEDANFHGIVNFYGSEGKPGTPEYRWHEYNAKFTDGNLQEIVLVETT